MGSRDQLTDQAMDEDFRVLRQSLKNIEIVLYDELLERLRNQRTKLYLELDLKLKAAVAKIVV
jgi:hypothetical protein